MTEIIQHVWGESRPVPPRLVGRARLTFIDPPYNQGVKYADDPTGDRLPDHLYKQWCLRTITELEQTLVPGGTLWWMTPERHADFIGTALSSHIGPRLYRIIFEESFAQYQQKTLTEDYRMIFCHQKPGGDLVFNPDDIRETSVRQLMGDKRADPRGRVPGQVWKMRRLQGTSKHRVDWHPTQLAPEVLERIVRGWTRPGELVIDACGGSGNMGLVCDALKRECVLVDRSPTYCDRMSERLMEERGVPATQTTSAS